MAPPSVFTFRIDMQHHESGCRCVLHWVMLTPTKHVPRKLMNREEGFPPFVGSTVPPLSSVLSGRTLPQLRVSCTRAFLVLTSMNDVLENRKSTKQVLTVLSGIAQSAYKMCGDVRLLANLKEVEEPFAKTQVLVVHGVYFCVIHQPRREISWSFLMNVVALL